MALHSLRIWKLPRDGRDDCTRTASEALLGLYLAEAALTACTATLQDASGRDNSAQLVDATYFAAEIDSPYYGCDGPGETR